MTKFQKALLTVSAKELAISTKVPLRTVYHWRQGESTPNAWTQTWVMQMVEMVKADRKGRGLKG